MVGADAETVAVGQGSMSNASHARPGDAFRRAGPAAASLEFLHPPEVNRVANPQARAIAPAAGRADAHQHVIKHAPQPPHPVSVSRQQKLERQDCNGPEHVRRNVLLAGRIEEEIRTLGELRVSAPHDDGHGQPGERQEAGRRVRVR